MALCCKQHTILPDNMQLSSLEGCPLKPDIRAISSNSRPNEIIQYSIQIQSSKLIADKRRSPLQAPLIYIVRPKLQALGYVNCVYHTRDGRIFHFHWPLDRARMHRDWEPRHRDCRTNAAVSQTPKQPAVQLLLQQKRNSVSIPIK